MKKMSLPALCAAAMLAAGAAHGAEHVIVQKGKSFSANRLSVKLGDSVKFVNEDPFSHNVFSLSDAKSFDLGSYGQGSAKSITLDKPGTVEVECAVHPDMKLMIEVAK